MTTAKKLQVFVSSTYEDMKGERQAVVEAILLAGHIPAGMELFTSGDESQWNTIKRWIDDSDVFLLILGGRYGSIEPKSGKSYIHLEYEYAQKRKKPVIAFVVGEQFLDKKIKRLLRKAVETANGKLLNDFRGTVRSKMAKTFESLDRLKTETITSLKSLERV